MNSIPPSDISRLLKDCDPQLLTTLDIAQLEELAGIVRQRIIDVISSTGGHLASSLGTVELTIALYNVFNIDKNKVIWDVGHQGYSHKLLTGRNYVFPNIGQRGGIAKFLEKTESKYDHFGAGHASTALSASLGFCLADDLQNKIGRVIAIVGDGAMSGGLSFEAMNLAGHLKKDMIVVLNDNGMSIGKNIGLLTNTFNLIQKNKIYNYIRFNLQNIANKGFFPQGLLNFLKRFDHSFMSFLSPQAWFESLGFRYFGPIDGHNIKELVSTFKSISKLHGPLLVHTKTTKGKGYYPAENDSISYHGVSAKAQKKNTVSSHKPTFTQVWSTSIAKILPNDSQVVIVCAAMVESYGLLKLKTDYPQRVIDAGIAEASAVCMAAGMAAGGLKPFVAIYSTFLQRAFDQLIHDVALQNLAVRFIIDRAGFVGPDGATHNGVFDLSYLLLIPNMIIMAPRNAQKLSNMITFSYHYDKGPIAIRYPRSSVDDISSLEELDFAQKPLKLGAAELLVDGDNLTIITVGNLYKIGLEVREKLLSAKYSAAVIDAQFIKPFDEDLFKTYASKHKLIVTIEENTKIGGFGSFLLGFINEQNLQCTVLNFAVSDSFIHYGTIEQQRHDVGLDVNTIFNKILDRLQVINQ